MAKKVKKVAKKASKRKRKATSLINRSQVKQFILDACKKQRAHEFTQVSKEALDMAEAKLRTWLRDRIHRMPSLGKTVRFD